MNNNLHSIQYYITFCAMTGALVCGCSMYDASMPGVYVTEYRNFESTRDYHEIMAILPIAIKTVTREDLNLSLDGTQEVSSISHDQELQQYLYNELLKGVKQGRITIDIQNMWITNRRLADSNMYDIEAINIGKHHRGHFCRLLDVDVLGYVELSLTFGDELNNGQLLDAAQSAATYYDCKSGNRIWRFHELVKDRELIEFSDAIEVRLLKRVSWFFPYEVIL